MPLKHGTETALIVLLALMIALAGVVAAFLPPVSVAVLPWALAFIVSIIYPLALYPMLREARVEYEFRALHFAPALMLLLWLVFDLLASFRPSLEVFQSSYTWAWSLPIVLLFFALLLLFCLHVIRRRLPRTMILLAVLIPFVALSQWSERSDWDRKVAMTLWNGALSGSGMIAQGDSSSNLDPSNDVAEEQWREQLRQMERRRQELEQANQSSSSADSSMSEEDSSSSVMIAVNSTSSESDGTVNPPPNLPSSGFGFEGIALALAAGFCAAVQRKTIARARS